MKFKAGDKVVRTARCADGYTVKQGGEYFISKVDDEWNRIYLAGVYDCDGQPDWFNPDNFELVEAVNDLAKAQKQVDKELTPFEKKGWTENSIFKVVGKSCSHQFDIGSLVVLHEDNGFRQPCFKPQEFHGKEADYDEDCWYMYFQDLEYISEVVEQQKGVKKLSTLDYADKSIFKVINAYDSCFEVGDLVVIDSEHGDYDARFKLVSEYGQYRKPFINWLLFEGLEYVGELGSDMVKENTAIQKDKAYHKMSPDALIPISIDGNDFEVSLGGLLLARYIIGEANGSYLYSLYCALGVIDKEDSVVHFESQNPVDCSHYQKDLFSKYFKDEVKESKKLEIKAQIESLQEQLKTLD